MDFSEPRLLQCTLVLQRANHWTAQQQRMSTNVQKMSEKCPKNIPKLSGGAENTIFGHPLDNPCLFGQCFGLVTLSNARPFLQPLLHTDDFRDSRDSHVKTRECYMSVEVQNVHSGPLVYPYPKNAANSDHGLSFPSPETQTMV